ncbi:type II toxin-antitoxin system RelB/DinJ family antitoxin [Suttonella ornithocola]|uniref:Bifunctional antitoxin/transcriptional repressor RelB n=1 Tax=Suttonella ornithocola TaxID=279832 RepID=A0A380MWZ4_9GAMM|nr:type II toxin-antitoxin system RelB/DinJ family antitoxin [Suttonella ornithocola]SUO96694.1 bifunctional antitoxin/transcriptional repressor RelB [Suttonella ornithocola]
MGSSNLNVRLDDDLREEATQVLAGYGLSPTQAIKLFFNQVAATRKVPLSFDFQSEKNFTLTSKTQAGLRQTEREFANGEVEHFDNVEELNQIIEKTSHD